MCAKTVDRYRDPLMKISLHSISGGQKFHRVPLNVAAVKDKPDIYVLVSCTGKPTSDSLPACLLATSESSVVRPEKHTIKEYEVVNTKQLLLFYKVTEVKTYISPLLSPALLCKMK